MSRRAVASTVGLVLAGVVFISLGLAGCATPRPNGLGSARDAYDAISRLGLDCAEPVIGDAADLPYTSISCGGLRIDWLDDPEGYADLVRQDCAATPVDRPQPAAVPLVVGERWVLRGIDPAHPGSWPRGISPQEAADRLGGAVTDTAAYCATA